MRFFFSLFLCLASLVMRVRVYERERNDKHIQQLIERPLRTSTKCMLLNHMPKSSAERCRRRRSRCFFFFGLLLFIDFVFVAHVCECDCVKSTIHFGQNCTFSCTAES